MARLTERQRAMILASEESDLSKLTPDYPPTGAGVELWTPGDYSTARALERRGLGSWEQGQWSNCGLYFNNDRGLDVRAALEQTHDRRSDQAHDQPLPRLAVAG